jgi:methyl-accepting chemotaxis protein
MKIKKKMKLTLKKKFLVPTISLLILGMGITSTVSYVKSKNALSEALIGQETQLALSTVKFLSTWLRDRKLDVMSWSEQQIFETALKDSFVGEAARKAANANLAKLKESYQYYESICLADLSGKLVAASSPELIGKLTVSDREYFKESVQGKIFVTDILKSKDTGNPVFFISSPIKVKDEVKGVLFSILDMSAFSSAFVDPIKVGKTGYAYIYNRNGDVVAHPDKKQILTLNMKQFDFGKQMMEKGDGVITYTWNGAEKVVAYQTYKEAGWTLAVSGVTDEIFAPVNDLRTLSILMSALVVLLAGGIIFFIANSVVKPINRVVDGLRDAAEGDGDLTKRLAVKSNDEVGDLAKWFNIFIEKIQAIIAEVTQNAGRLTESSKALAAISEQMSTGADQMFSKANTVSSAGEEMSISMTNVASTMEQATGNMNMVATAAEQMNATISEIAQNTEKARETTGGAVKQAERASDQMNGLGNAAQEIEKVIETITDISEQVNLLALNATIEAARAGEAGKGFAVVANEIKELARQTAGATGEIKQRVEAIQGSTESTIKEIETITTVVTGVNEIVSTIATAIEEQSVTTREIASNVAQASNGLNEVNANVAQSSTVTKDIARDITEVTQAANEMSNSGSQIKNSSVELSGLAEKLNEMVGRFKV